MRPLPRAIAIVAAIVGGLPCAALAGPWLSTTAGVSEVVTSGTLVAPTGITAVCSPILSVHVTVGWTPNGSALTAGYAVLRATAFAGPYTVVGTTSDGSSTSYTDTTTSLIGIYWYEVESTHALWTSPPSAKVGVSTVAVLCV